MSSEEEDYITVSRSVFTDVVFPTISHSDFDKDAGGHHALLALLFEKLAIEHRTMNHQLFLELDTEVRVCVSPVLLLLSSLRKRPRESHRA